jgi:FKBP-type peptidyl-prolyl cis-trans isomerase SlyD
MEVMKDKVVSIDYTLTGTGGQVLDSSKDRGPLMYLHGASNIIPGLENALAGKNEGDQLNVSVAPEEAYGQHDPQMVQQVPRSSFGGVQEITAGMQFQAQTSGGPRLVRIADVQGDTIIVDANHPLAGQTLNFDVTVVAVRDATPEELAHGHVHGPGGHH